MSNNEQKRPLSLENAVQIGHGFYSDVYRLDDDKIVKVLKNAEDFTDAKREANLSRQAFFRGIPTPISYDVADVDGKPALVYEFLNCRNLRDTVLNDPENFDIYMQQYALLMRRIHATEADTAKLPAAADVAYSKLNYLRGHLTEEEFSRLSALLKTPPARTTYIHGDCHGKNVKVYNGEMYLIDLDSLSYGDPVFEFASVFETYRVFYEISKDGQEKFLGLPEETSARIFSALLSNYFAPLPEDVIAENLCKIKLLGYLATYWWMVYYAEDWDDHAREVCYNGVKKYINKVDDLILSYPEE